MNKNETINVLTHLCRPTKFSEIEGEKQTHYKGVRMKLVLRGGKRED